MLQISPQKVVAGDTFPLPHSSLSGDFGLIRQVGKNKLIRWEPFRANLDSLNGVEIFLKTAIVPLSPQTFWGIAAQGSNTAPIGFKIVRLGQIGFFAGGRLGALPADYRYEISDTGAMDFTESGIYRAGSRRRLASFAATGGLVFQVGRRFYLFGGLGFGLEQLFWEYEAFNLDKQSLGNFWALNKSINRRGLAADAGVVLRRRHWFFELGCSSIRAQNLQITAAVGYILSNERTDFPKNSFHPNEPEIATPATPHLQQPLLRYAEQDFFGDLFSNEKLAATPTNTSEPPLQKPEGKKGVSVKQTPNEQPRLKTTPVQFFKVKKATSLREKPDHLADVLHRLQQGEKVILIEKTNKDWWRVESRGKQGFVKEERLRKK